MYKNILNYFKDNDEQVSVWIGGVVVFLVAVLFFWYFRSVNTVGQISESASTTEYKLTEVLSEKTVDNLPVSYQIRKGDTLWKIAETVFDDGFLWVNIYEANKEKIADPNKIEDRLTIIIPKIDDLPDLVSYTIQKGDSLWKIAESQCGSGYQWTEIARQNELVNPAVIHTGNVLKFRCRVR